MKTKVYTILAALLLPLLFSSPAKAQMGACDGKIERRIVLVGDSWAHFTWIYRSMYESLKANGFADITEDGTRTALISTQAEFWDTEEGLQIITDRIDQLPAADVFIIFIGGNDVMWKWRRDKPFEELLPFSDAMLGHTDNIINAIQAARPNAQIIIGSYDYPNFAETMVDNEWNPYYDQWVKFGFAPPIELNVGLQFFEEYRANWPRYNLDSNVHFINNIGVAQYYLGFPDSAVFEPYVPFAPRTVPLPFGDPRYPTSRAGMGLEGWDAYHFNEIGYKYIGDNMIKQFIGEYFRKDKAQTLKSVGGSAEGWVTPTGVTGTNEVRIGKNQNLDYAGIFTFNTADIPDDAELEGASIYITRSRLVGNAPLDGVFPANVQVDLKAGGFGPSAAIEKEDWNAPADVSAAGCIVGSGRGEEYKLRIDLNAEALAAINKQGTTQFRIKFSLAGPSNRLMHFFDGDEEDNYLAPFMDVYYSNVRTAVRDNRSKPEQLAFFPNPTTGKLNFEVPSALRNDNVQATVFNTLGAVVLSKNLFTAGVPVSNLDLGQLPDGAYVLQLTDGTTVAGGQFVLHK
jgi:lysophospholipase L1-like esterase